mgnify:CR=1 FL=1
MIWTLRVGEYTSNTRELVVGFVKATSRDTSFVGGAIDEGVMHDELDII